ncbi:MAG: hypothetical protein ACREMQ_09445 [Longimicrobiales bacterium]
MSLSATDRLVTRLAAFAVVALSVPGGARAQNEADVAQRVRSSQIEVYRRVASLRLEFSDGQVIELGVRDGRAFSGNRQLGEVPAGSPLDRSWRELLTQAMELTTPQLAQALLRWQPPAGELGQHMDSILEAALHGVPLEQTLEAQAEAVEAEAEALTLENQATGDSVQRLVERITELEEELVERAEADADPDIVIEPSRGFSWLAPFRYIARGLAGIISILVTFAVVFGIGIAAIFFGGRRYIETVADTARHATMRSLLVGLAGTFLVIPAFILGIIALAISIVGIPALLVWIPVFPVATALAILLGYISVAHALGESLAERRFYTSDWFQRGNSYYFIMSGLAFLMALFIASQIVGMAGPWLGFFRGALTALGVIVTWAALSVGFGAVLLTRGGSRPARVNNSAEPEIYAEEAHV